MTVPELFNFSFQGVSWVAVELLVLLQMSPIATAQNGTGTQGQKSLDSSIERRLKSFRASETHTVLRPSSALMTVPELFNFSFQGVSWVAVELLVLLQMSPIATAQNGTGTQGQKSLDSSIEVDKRIARIMVIIVCVIFFLGFSCVYIRQCTNGSISGGFDLATINIGRNGLRSRFARGLGVDTIKTFPTFFYSTVKGLKIGKGSLECAVCLNEFEDKEILRLLPKCSHAFHADCIDAWLASHSTCPVCRTNLVPEPGEIPSTSLAIPDQVTESDQPDQQRFDADEMHARVDDSAKNTRDSEAPSLNLVYHTRGTNQDRPPRFQSTGARFAGTIQRSHSTGHSLVLPDENYERFTLRFPDDVQSRLKNSTLNRANSCLPFPREQISARRYRSASGGTGTGRNHQFHERFDRSDRWKFTFTPDFIYRTGSVRSPKTDIVYAGERSTDRLHIDSQV